jgi:type IV secretory pathway component VirB8
MGLPLVQQYLQMSITDPTENVEAQRWISEQTRKNERREQWRYHVMLWLTFIAAVAAVIAALPVVQG